ncbi:hypothetical protein [Delftia acidovorans]|uniref:hypothetical protein n=1 Tax=Delftia acidovorans TaxID=80866 RepID=UPI003D13763E
MTNYYASAPRDQENILTLVDHLLARGQSGLACETQTPQEPTPLEHDTYSNIRESIERRRDAAISHAWRLDESLLA